MIRSIWGSFVELCGVLAFQHCRQPASVCGLTVSAGQRSRRGLAESSAQGLQPPTWCLQGRVSSGGSAGAGGLPSSSGQFPELLSLQSPVGAPFAPPARAGWVVPEVLPCGCPHSRSQGQLGCLSFQAGQSSALVGVESHVRCHAMGPWAAAQSGGGLPVAVPHQVGCKRQPAYTWRQAVALVMSTPGKMVCFTKPAATCTFCT